MCLNKHNYTGDICTNLSSYEDIEEEVQRSVTDYEAVRTNLGIPPKYI